jgi:hypothetical protein
MVLPLPDRLDLESGTYAANSSTPMTAQPSGQVPANKN